jgi:hypothetical protein
MTAKMKKESENQRSMRTGLITNPFDLANLDKIRKEWLDLDKKMRAHLPNISAESLSKEDFIKFLTAFCTVWMRSQNDLSSFVVDERNAPVIDQLYLYLTRNKSCEWPLLKGFILLGGPGTGKTTLLKGFFDVINHYYTNINYLKLPKWMTAKEAVKLIVENNGKMPLGMVNSALFLDELGRHEMRVQIYGNPVCPITELIFDRYSKGLPTFSTSNFKFETMAGMDFFGPVATDRLRSMFHIVEMTGESRRK